MMSIMTGVVSDNMLKVRESMERENEDAEQERRVAIARELEGVFSCADIDGDGTMSQVEFEQILKNKKEMKRLHSLTSVRTLDLIELFAWLDYDKNGEVTLDEFVNGFRWIHEPVTGKSLVKLEQHVICHLRQSEQRIQEKLDKEFTELFKKLRKMNALVEQVQKVENAVCNLQTDVKDFRCSIDPDPSFRPTRKVAAEEPGTPKWAHQFQRSLSTLSERLEGLERKMMDDVMSP